MISATTLTNSSLQKKGARVEDELGGETTVGIEMSEERTRTRLMAV